MSSFPNFSSPILMSKILIGVGIAVVVIGNGIILSSGWINQIKPVTGVYLIDGLLTFFPDIQINEASSLIMEIIAAFAITASTAIVYEGSRRRNEISQYALAGYWWIAQFVAIGLATPFFFAYLLHTKSNVKNLVQVGPIRAYGVFIGIFVTGIVNEMLNPSLKKGDVNLTLLSIWLLWPVVVISGSILIDLNPKKSPPPAIRMIQEFPYIVSVLNSAKAQFLFLQLLATVGPAQSVRDILHNPPAMFLIFDTLGVILGVYGWLYADGKVSLQTMLPILFLFGPGAHVALLCLIRGRQVDGM
jgi:hypothetical protein